MPDNTAKPKFKRKQLIVARTFQLKYAGVILSLMFITALFCSYAIYYTTMVMFGEKLANVYPQGQLVSIVNTVNFRILVSILVISPFVGFLGIYLSHKIAGPLYRIERVIGNMAKGDLSEHITLRRGDEMVSLADSINKLADSLTNDIVAEKTSMENVLKDLNSLKERTASCASGDQTKIKEVAENLTNEIKLISKSLDKYKV